VEDSPGRSDLTNHFAPLSSARGSLAYMNGAVRMEDLDVEAPLLLRESPR
jgi:hypothetical protein